MESLVNCWMGNIEMNLNIQIGHSLLQLYDHQVRIHQTFHQAFAFKCPMNPILDLSPILQQFPYPFYS